MVKDCIQKYGCPPTLKMQTIKRGEGKALARVNARNVFKSSCGVKTKMISIFILAE